MKTIRKYFELFSSVMLLGLMICNLTGCGILDSHKKAELMKTEENNFIYGDEAQR